MITTVTTVTTVTTIVAMGLTTIIGIAAIASLVAFLAIKELAGANRLGSSVRIAKFTNVSIWPLTIVLGVFTAIKIIEVLA